MLTTRCLRTIGLRNGHTQIAAKATNSIIAVAAKGDFSCKLDLQSIVKGADFSLTEALRLDKLTKAVSSCLSKLKVIALKPIIASTATTIEVMTSTAIGSVGRLVVSDWRQESWKRPVELS